MLKIGLFWQKCGALLKMALLLRVVFYRCGYGKYFDKWAIFHFFLQQHKIILELLFYSEDDIKSYIS